LNEDEAQAMKRRIYFILAVNVIFISLLGYIALYFPALRRPCLIAYFLGQGVLAFFCVQWWDKSFALPLKKISESAHKTVKGDQNCEFYGGKIKELNELAYSLNNLRDYFLSVQQEIIEKLIESEEIFVQMIFMINAAVEAKDMYTSGHSSKVAEYVRGIVLQLGISPELSEKIVLAALLHDVGKIGISESILNKTKTLTDEEYNEIKRHTGYGRDILANSASLWDILPFIYHHHEHFNGNGYPHGLKGEEIPIGSRIIAVADSYDAMTSDRPYRKAMSQDEACQILIEEKDRQFEAQIVDAFLSSIGWPPYFNSNYETISHQPLVTLPN
jgi:HD-GYP domain-containing protein (c-di-GMP phosphodiesterase class II)